MLLDLLVPEAIAGQVKHVYYHDAESFIWVLTWVCLRYDNGRLLSKNRPLNEWLTVGATECHDKKMGFLRRLHSMHPTPSHQKNFDVAMHCLVMVYRNSDPFAIVVKDNEVVFNTWLQNHVPQKILQGDISPVE